MFSLLGKNRYTAGREYHNGAYGKQSATGIGRGSVSSILNRLIGRSGIIFVNADIDILELKLRILGSGNNKAETTAGICLSLPS